MIPWFAFRPNEQHPDWRADLNEHNLYYWIPKGPSQLNRGLDSPMLELAHERQFAIAQLGTRSVGFEVEHSRRIQDALTTLDGHFAVHQIDKPCRPNSPHGEHLFDFRIRSHGYSPLPPLEITDHKPSTSSPITELEKPSRSPLALKELMNPAPPPSSSLKRKSSDDFIAASIAVDGIDVSDSYNNLVLVTTPHIQYPRASKLLADGTNTRTRRDVRMRRSVLVNQQPLDANQLEKDGQLLLALSQSRKSMES